MKRKAIKYLLTFFLLSFIGLAFYFGSDSHAQTSGLFSNRGTPEAPNFGSIDALNRLSESLMNGFKYVEAREYADAALRKAEKEGYTNGKADALYCIGLIYWYQDNFKEALIAHQQALLYYQQAGNEKGCAATFKRLGHDYADLEDYKLAMNSFQSALQMNEKSGDQLALAANLDLLGYCYMRMSDDTKALEYYNKSLAISERLNDKTGIAGTCNDMAELFELQHNLKVALQYAKRGLAISIELDDKRHLRESYKKLERIYLKMKNYEEAYNSRLHFDEIHDFLYKTETSVKISALQLKYEAEKKNQQIALLNKDNEIQEKVISRQRITRNAFIVGFFLVLLLGIITFRQYRTKKKVNEELERSIEKLKSTQQQLIQQEKLASLGELIAGIAHEIKNPLNFITNYSEINAELIEELNEVGTEEEKNEILTAIKNNQMVISKHGKTADSIVKNMLEFSRTGNNEKLPVDLNKMCEENMNLAYHGCRANYPDFNCEMKVVLAPDLPLVNCVPQDISRVILNLFTNAFYELQKRKNGILELTTAVSENQVLISIKDNGAGIPEAIRKKIFEPFFTTKPAGKGTGLGLSLSFDIIKAHQGELNVKSKEGEYTEFQIILPV